MSCLTKSSDGYKEKTSSKMVLSHSLSPSRYWTRISSHSVDEETLNSNILRSSISKPIDKPMYENSHSTLTNHKFSNTFDENGIDLTVNSQKDVIKSNSFSNRMRFPTNHHLGLKDISNKHPMISSHRKNHATKMNHFLSRIQNRSERQKLEIIDANIKEHRPARILDPSNVWVTHTRGSMTVRLRVLCHQNYYGNGCVSHCKGRDDIVGHYRCTNKGRRVCLPGWKGDNCTEALCHHQCLPSRGRCFHPFTCTCLPGWHGEHCNQCQRMDGCKHGFCHRPGQCLCQTGWSGTRCNEVIDYEGMLCQHGGTRIRGKSCLCVSGYTGMFCEFQLCEESICDNNGTCLMSLDGPYCVCQPPYVGESCERLINDSFSHSKNRILFKSNSSCAGSSCYHHKNNSQSNSCDNFPCYNNGSCYLDSLKDNTPYCRCSLYFTGNHCESFLDPCENNPCYNDGKCSVISTDEFQFRNEYQNNLSSEIISRNKDRTLPYFAILCHCKDGFTGDRCNETSISVNTNKNNCNFNHDHDVESTDEDIDTDQQRVNNEVSVCSNTMACYNGGSCIPLKTKGSFLCNCRKGWTGEFCEINTKDPCSSHVCLNEGTCVVDTIRGSSAGLPKCMCQPGYNGFYCESPVEVCSQTHCRNGGICIEHQGEFFCVCRRRYFGRLCERSWYSHRLMTASYKLNLMTYSNSGASRSIPSMTMIFITIILLNNLVYNQFRCFAHYK